MTMNGVTTRAIRTAAGASAAALAAFFSTHAAAAAPQPSAAPAKPTLSTCVETKYRDYDALAAWEADAITAATRANNPMSRAFAEASRVLRQERSAALDAIDKSALDCLAAASRGAQVRTLVVIGDNITRPHALRPSQGWVGLMEARLAEKGPAWQVVNNSAVGRLSIEGVRELPALLEKHRPSLVVIALGAIDAVHGRDVDEARSNLADLIALARKAGAVPVLVGNVVNNRRNGYANPSFLRMYAELAEREKVALVPYLMDGVTTFLADDIHPDAQAQAKMLDNAWPVLQPLLAKK